MYLPENVPGGRDRTLLKHETHRCDRMLSVRYTRVQKTRMIVSCADELAQDDAVARAIRGAIGNVSAAARSRLAFERRVSDAVLRFIEMRAEVEAALRTPPRSGA